MRKNNTKRYTLIFKTLTGVESFNKDTYFIEKPTYSEEEFDELKDVNDTISEYTALYKDEIRPVYIDNHYVHKRSGVIKRFLADGSYGTQKVDNPSDWTRIREHWDFSDGKKWWGYIVLDYLEERIIKAGGDYQVLFCNKRKTGSPWNDRYIKYVNIKTDLHYRDIYFGRDDEIPKDYVWDGDEEYEGWLQYRWGDGKNSITYVEPEKKKKPVKTESEAATEEDLKKYLCNYSEDDPNDDPICDPNDDLNESEYEDIEEKYIAEDTHKFKDNNPWY